MITPYSEKLESENLMYHMLPEHLIYISSGLLMCFGFEELILNSVISKKKNSFRTKLTKIYSKLIALNFKINSHGIVTAVLILIILIYWHIPEVFTFAWHDDSFHIKMHISYITIGILIFLMDKVTSLLEKSIFTIIIGKFMLIGGTILLFNNSNHYYITYPIEQQTYVGLFMVLMDMIVGSTVIVYTFLQYFKKWD